MEPGRGPLVLDSLRHEKQNEAWASSLLKNGCCVPRYREKCFGAFRIVAVCHGVSPTGPPELSKE